MPQGSRGGRVTGNEKGSEGRREKIGDEVGESILVDDRRGTSPLTG